MAPDAVAALKLRAEDAEDLAVLSACLQDAFVPVRDLAYVAADRRFLLAANRFRWERSQRQAMGRPGYERVLCALTFDEIDRVSYRGFSRRDEDRILSLLAIRATGGDRGVAAIRLEFSEGVTIRLGTAHIRCRVEDFGEPWPTRWLPRHEAAEGR
jgi:hypothetical protein